MDLSALKSAEPIETKAVSAVPIRIVWDHLGCFPPQVVPVLFPPIQTRHAETHGRDHVQ